MAVPAVMGYSITPFADGYEAAVNLETQDHGQALDHLASTFHQLGYGAVQATIIEFATSWVEGGALGTISRTKPWCWSFRLYNQMSSL